MTANAKTAKKRSTDSRHPAKKKRPSAKALRRARARRRFYGTLSAILFLLLCALVLVGSVAISNYSEFTALRKTLDRPTFFPCVRVDGVDLSSCTLSQAMELFAAQEEAKTEQQGITFVAENKQLHRTAADLRYSSDYAQVLAQAWQVGRTGDISTRYADVSQEHNFTVSRGYDEAFLMQQATAIAQDLATPSADAYIADFDYSTHEFVIEPEKNGTFVDADKLYADILDAISSGSGTVHIEILSQTPVVTAELLRSTHGEMSTATTNASSSNDNRISNIRLACKNINVCVRPGEEFSFNETVGQRTKEAGFKKAGVYISGEVGEEIGGGICQVASTLFNAIVKADLEVTERHNHSRPVSYLDNGKDAAVSWGVQDLKFVNNTDEPVYIAATVTKNWRVNTRIYGPIRTDGVTVALVPVLKETVSPPKDTEYRMTSDLPTGEERVKSKARDGYRVNSYKAYYNANGDLIDKVFLCASYYPPKAKIVEIGK